VAASQLLANPFNHRRHPQKQRDVVSASIQELGFIKSVIVNQLTGHIVDGHERVMQALGVGDDTLVDVEYVELSPEDEKKALLLLDASSELATVDDSALELLIEDIEFDSTLLGDFAIDYKNLAEMTSDEWQGKPQADVDGIGNYDPSQETFSIRFDSVSAADRDKVKATLDEAITKLGLSYKSRVM
jgi:ParB-like chromosome segregation protein Spo0J